MGNSVQDFKGDAVGYRDRLRLENIQTDIANSWVTGGVPDLKLYASGSSSRCVDFNEPRFHKLMRLRANPRYSFLRKRDFGHSFAKESVTLSMPNRVNISQRLSGSTYRGHTGIFFPTVDYRLAMLNAALGRFPSIPPELGADRFFLWGLGSSVIAKSLPDVPEFSLFRFIGELKAGLPKVPLKTLAKERKLRNVGGEYLNVQFGIMPLISDLQNFFEAVSDPKLRVAVKRQLEQEHRVRKVIDKGTITTKRSMTSTEMNVMSVSTGQNGTVETSKTFRIWSSCSFAYYQTTLLDQLLTDLDDRLGGLGAVPTAIDMWNLLPWSWLVDWFTNFNHVITNLSYLGRDGLYLQRGYIMAHYQDVEIYRQSRVAFGTPISTTAVRTYDRKYRVKASPFGFGYTWKEFSPFQLSILGALGVSRLRV